MSNRIQDFQILKVKSTRVPRNRLGADGYGSTGTEYKILVGNRWHRVMVMSYGNGASHYIMKGGVLHHVDIDNVTNPVN